AGWPTTAASAFPATAPAGAPPRRPARSRWPAGCAKAPRTAASTATCPGAAPRTWPTPPRPTTASRAGRPRRPTSITSCGGGGGGGGPAVVDFYRDRPGFRESPRDLGVALVRVMVQHKLDAGVFGQQALEQLNAALAEAPDDATGWEAKGLLLAAMGQPSE